MDVRYKYAVGDMVEFVLTVYGSPKVYNGVIIKRYGNIKDMKIYQISCLQKGMQIYSISEALIIGLADGEQKGGGAKI